MNIIYGGRRTGKTTRLIFDAAINNKTIVVYNWQRAEYIKVLAKKLGVKIPPPVAISQITDNPKCWLGENKRCSIDDALDVLERIIYEKSAGHFVVDTVVINTNEIEGGRDSEGKQTPEIDPARLKNSINALEAYNDVIKDILEQIVEISRAILEAYIKDLDGGADYEEQ